MNVTPASTTARSSTWTLRETPVGPLLLASTDEGLVNVVFHADAGTADRALARIEGRLGSPPLRVEALPAGSLHADETVPDGAPTPHPALTAAADQLDAYFRGELRVFTVPLDWSLSGGFNGRCCVNSFASVPFGAVVGYEDLADRVGEPGAAQAVGAAMGSNPLPVVVPCHRVVESGGGLGGFGGGRETKRALLALEGLLPQPLF